MQDSNLEVGHRSQSPTENKLHTRMYMTVHKTCNLYPQNYTVILNYLHFMTNNRLTEIINYLHCEVTTLKTLQKVFNPLVPNINNHTIQQCSKCRTLNTVNGQVLPLLYSYLNSDLM